MKMAPAFPTKQKTDGSLAAVALLLADGNGFSYRNKRSRWVSGGSENLLKPADLHRLFLSHKKNRLVDRLRSWGTSIRFQPAPAFSCGIKKTDGFFVCSFERCKLQPAPAFSIGIKKAEGSWVLQGTVGFFGSLAILPVFCGG